MAELFAALSIASPVTPAVIAKVARLRRLSRVADAVVLDEAAARVVASWEAA